MVCSLTLTHTHTHLHTRIHYLHSCIYYIYSCLYLSLVAVLLTPHRRNNNHKMRQPSTQHLVALILCSVVCLVSASPLPQPAGNQELDVLQIPLANGKVSSIKLALTAVNAFVNSHNSFHANEKNIYLSASILYIFTTYPYIHIFLISYTHNIHTYLVYATHTLQLCLESIQMFNQVQSICK